MIIYYKTYTKEAIYKVLNPCYQFNMTKSADKDIFCTQLLMTYLLTYTKETELLAAPNGESIEKAVHCLYLSTCCHLLSQFNKPVVIATKQDWGQEL